MTDRDTTATPYRLSPDGACYFQYPAGDAPVVVVADYAELRTKGLADGAAISIVGADRRANGRFAYSAADPHGQGDDGGTVIAATDGWWVRDWRMTAANPLELDWWMPDESTVWTALLQQLADRSLSTWYIRTPTTVASGFLDKVVFPPGERFVLDGPSPFAFRQTSASYPKETADGEYSTESLVLDFRWLVLGSNVEFVGNPEYRNVLGPVWAERWRIQQPILDLAFETECILNCTITRPISAGVRVTKNSGLLRIGGKFYDADIDIVSGAGIAELVFDGAEFIDCSGGSMGIDPADPEGPSDLQFTRYRGFSLASARRVSGHLKAIGGGHLAGGTAGGQDGIGSAEEPLDIEYQDAGMRTDFPALPPRLADGYYNDGPGKFDGYQNGDNGVYIRFRYTGDTCYMYREMTLEASPDSVGEDKYCQNMHFEYRDETNPGAQWYRLRTSVFGEIFDDVGGGGIGRVYTNTWSNSTMGPFALQDGPNTMSGITVLRGNWVQHVGAFSVGSVDYLLTKYGIANPGATLTGITITEDCAQHNPQVPDGALIAIGEAETVTITDLVVEGGAPVHDLLQFTVEPVVLSTITVNLINPTIPSGYVVRKAPGNAAPDNTFIFQIDGVPQTLPWTAP